MPFNPFNFTFTPPQTVTAPAAETSEVKTTTSNQVTGDNSRAKQIANKLQGLIDTSTYLQSLILDRSGGLGVSIDSAADPQTARSLFNIYGENAPSVVTVPMYNQLLNAHLGILQLDMSLGKGSNLQPNPIQAADLMTVIKAVDNHLVQTGDYQSWLPLHLGSLKGDSILFQSWGDSLSTYPAYRTTSVVPTSLTPGVISAASVDLTHDLYEYEDSVTDKFAQHYSAVYQAMASVHAVERDISMVINEYFYQPLENVLRIISLFNALVGFVHKVSMEEIQADLVNYALVRLASEVSSMTHTADQLVSIAIRPLQGTLGSLGRIVSGVQQEAAEIGTLANGGLAGLTKANACGKNNPNNRNKSAASKPLKIPGLGEISEGLKYLGEKLDWAIREPQRKSAQLDKSFRQLINGRLSSHADRDSIMCSIRALNALLGAANGVANELRSGTSIAPSVTVQRQQEAVGRILTSLQTNTSTTFTTQDGQVIANAPDMPAAPQSVIDTLRTAKVVTTKGKLVL